MGDCDAGSARGFSGVVFLRISFPMGPTSVAGGKKLLNLNLAEVGDTVPFRRTIGVAWRDAGVVSTSGLGTGEGLAGVDWKGVGVLDGASIGNDSENSA